LIKSIPEVIPFFWHTLAHIAKEVLEGIRKCCFNYLWKISWEYKGSHLEKWKVIASPKTQGGRGLKYIHRFGHSLVKKSVWQLITRDNLWWRIIIQKYMAPYNVFYWIRMEHKSTENVSNHWKSLTQAFSVIGKYLA
jgi:hypothetical protein